MSHSSALKDVKRPAHRPSTREDHCGRCSARSLALCAMAINFLITLPTAAQRTLTRLGDVSHVQGLGQNSITGLGLITGLSGTGDGGKMIDTQRKLRQSLNYFASGVRSTDELKDAKNVATVYVEAIIPPNGAREGETLDVKVTAIAAKSLAGGQLLPTPLVYIGVPKMGVLARAGGPIEVTDPDHPTSGIIRNGARVEQDTFPEFLATGMDLAAAGYENSWIEPDKRYITLVIDDAHAGWAMAAGIAEEVNRYNSKDIASLIRPTDPGSGQDRSSKGASGEDRGGSSITALAIDGKNVVVEVPSYYQEDPVPYLRDLWQLELLADTGEARVTINRNLKTIVVTGNVRISPTVVSHAGLTLNVVPDVPGGRTLRASVEPQVFVPLDRETARSAAMADLLEALNRLKVPFEDRVAIITTLERSGNLHGKVSYEQ